MKKVWEGKTGVSRKTKQHRDRGGSVRERGEESPVSHVAHGEVLDWCGKHAWPN